MKIPNLKLFFKKIFSLLSVVRGYNILVLIIAQYLAAIFVFSHEKALKSVVLDVHLFFIVFASVCVVAAGYIINNFYDAKADIINRPIKAKIDGIVREQTKLNLYFFLNFLGFLFGWLVSWRAAFFFSVYIFAIWLYSHKLKKHPFIGLLSATILTILPFFAIFVYYKNFSKIIFVHATFLVLVLLIRELIKDLENIKGAIANNYTTFSVKYGEENSKKFAIFLIISTFVPVALLFSYPAIGYMKYYFYAAMIILIFTAVYLWRATDKKQYVLLHNVLKLLLFVGVFSLLFLDPSLLIDKVIDKLH